MSDMNNMNGYDNTNEVNNTNGYNSANGMNNMGGYNSANGMNNMGGYNSANGMNNMNGYDSRDYHYNGKVGYNPLDDRPKKSSDDFAKGLFVGILVTTIIAMGLFIANTLIFNLPLTNSDSDHRKQEIEIDENYTEIVNKIEMIQPYIDKFFYYSDDIDNQKLVDYAIKGFVAGLEDKYADYYTAEEFRKIKESNSGTYCGIGVVVQMDTENNMVLVSNPYENAPGYKAGIRQGDYIIAIDDKDISGMTLDEAVTYIRGDEGTEVKITVYRDGKKLDFTIKREKIESETVKLEMLENGIAHIKIGSFDDITDEQFEKAVNDALAKNAKGFIFDVRSNGGGYYDVVVKMLDSILPEGRLVYIEDKEGHRNEEKSDAKCLDKPMCVLVNQYSASASEIFAGAIQDFEAGAIIGMQTYGKGIVQNTYTFKDGSALKFTIAGYFTPNGRNIHGVGITPDIEVELPKDESAYDKNGVLKEGQDTQLNEAIKYINDKIDK